ISRTPWCLSKASTCAASPGSRFPKSRAAIGASAVSRSPRKPSRSSRLDERWPDALSPCIASGLVLPAVLRGASLPHLHPSSSPCPVLVAFRRARRTLLTPCWQQAFDRKHTRQVDRVPATL